MSTSVCQAHEFLNACHPGTLSLLDTAPTLVPLDSTVVVSAYQSATSWTRYLSS